MTKHLILLLVLFLNINTEERPPLSPDEADSWMKKSQEQFNPKQWPNSTDVSSLIEFLTLLENNTELFTFFYNTNDTQTFGISPFFKATSSMISNINPNVKNVTINMEKHGDIASYFGIPNSHTSIIYFYNQAPIIFKFNQMYEGKKPIDQWMREVQQKADKIVQIKEENDMDVFENSSSLILMIVNPEDEHLGKKFSSLAYNYPELTFVWMIRNEDTKKLEQNINEDFAFESSSNNRLISIKFEEEEYFSKDLISKNIVDIGSFVMEHRFSKVMLLMDETVNKVFYERKPTVLLLLRSQGRIFKTFKKIVSEYDNINILYDNFSKSHGKHSLVHMMDILGLSANDLPILIMLPFTEPKNGISPKYKTKELSGKNIKEFIDKGLNNELEYYKRSEDIGENLRAKGYTTITLNNFEETISNTNKHFLIGFELFQTYTPPALLNSMDKLYNELENLGLKETLEVGICDLFKNEIGQLVTIEKIPEIILFKKNGDKHERIYYKGEINYSFLRDWTLKQLDNMQEPKEIDL